ncbi:MAG: Maf-like protein [Rhizobiaceae bacterium]|nr:Maf-like protein [Rhizobiaceae bacterium]
MAAIPKLVLASGSPRRLQLLQQAGVDPEFLSPVDADETPKKGEVPRSLAKRLAREKAELALENVNRSEEMKGSIILAADTVVGMGRRVLPKAEMLDEASNSLRLLSGRNHRVYTGITLVSASGSMKHRLVETRVRFKRLSRDEMEAYLASGEWRGKAGGYAIQGIAGSFVVKLVGSYTNVVGLPLYEAISLINSEGYPVHFNWTNRSGI